MHDGSIDRTTPEEAIPFLDRCETPAGIARELWVLHEAIKAGGYIPRGSDLCTRTTQLLSIASGTLMRLSTPEPKVTEGGQAEPPPAPSPPLAWPWVCSARSCWCRS